MFFYRIVLTEVEIQQDLIFESSSRILAQKKKNGFQNQKAFYQNISGIVEGLSDDTIAQIKEYLKSGNQRKYYLKEEMEFFDQYPSPLFFCKHIVDAIDIWADRSHRQENLIGEGSFGRVYRGKFTVKKNGVNEVYPVAAKFIPYLPTTMKLLPKEINFLRMMSNSDHHLPLYNCFYESEKDRRKKNDKRADRKSVV